MGLEQVSIRGNKPPGERCVQPVNLWGFEPPWRRLRDSVMAHFASGSHILPVTVTPVGQVKKQSDEPVVT